VTPVLLPALVVLLGSIALLLGELRRTHRESGRAAPRRSPRPGGVTALTVDVGPPPLFALEEVCKTFAGADGAVHVLDRVSLQAPAADGVLGIQGPSGCGKTTLLHLLAGLDVPSSGRLRVLGQRLGRNLRQLHAHRRQVGLVLQERNLIAHLSARDNVAMPLALHGVPWSEARARAEFWLTTLGLRDCMLRKPAALSGGQQQRVAIARALAGKAKLLLADEPTAALDDASADQVCRALRQAAAAGVAVVLVSHDARTLAACDHVLRYEQGCWRMEGVATANEPAPPLPPPSPSTPPPAAAEHPPAPAPAPAVPAPAPTSFVTTTKAGSRRSGRQESSS
jgi:ABC-type lipoprotein export system ATPase subunit